MNATVKRLALSIASGLVIAVTANAQTPPVPAGLANTAQAQARMQQQQVAAQTAMVNATTPEEIAKAGNGLRQTTAAQIAVATDGQSPQQAAATISQMNRDAAQQQAAVDDKATLARDLANATTAADKAAVWKVYDAKMAQLRITQEVTGEALRRLNPVNPPTGYRGPTLPPEHRDAYNATQARLEDLIITIANNRVEEPRLPSYTNPGGSRASDLDREIEEHRRAAQRNADIQEYMRLADGGVFVDPTTGAPLSQEMRDRIAKNAKLQLADTLKANGLDLGAVNTLFGWTDARTATGQQIEDEVRSNNYYQALDMLNPSLSGANPQQMARAMAAVMNLSAAQIDAWRSGQIPEGGNGGLTGWMYENFWAKQKVGLATAFRISDLSKGGEIDKQIEAYHADVDAAVAALNEMARTADPKDLSATSRQLLESMGFIAKVDGKDAYRIPTGADTAERLKRKLNLPGSSMLDMVSSANVIKIVIMVATPELAASRVGTALEGLELGIGAVRTGEFVTNVLMNGALDASFQKIETGTVQWDRVVLDAVVVNVGLGLAGEVTGTIASRTITGAMSADARFLAETFAKNKATKEAAESMLRQTLGLYADSALLTYWQSHFQAGGMSYDDFLANMLNGVVGRLAPTAARIATQGVATGIGNYAPRTLKDAIYWMAPELRDVYVKGLTGDSLVKYLETARVREQETARREATDRLSRALGDDYLKMDLTDPALIDKVTLALESGALTFTDLKAILGDTPTLTGIVDGVNAQRLRTFDQIVATARERAAADINAEYAARMQRFKDNLGEGSEQYKEAERATTGWRDGELKKLNDKIEVPGSTNNTSDIDRSITSTYLRNSLKTVTDEVFMQRTGLERASTSAQAYDVNEYFNIFKVIDRMKASGIDLRTATHTTADGTTISHGDMMDAMGLATAMLDMPPAQREKFKQNRTATGDPARMERLFKIAEDSLAQAQKQLDAEMKRLATQGYDPNNPDTITRARDNLYGERATELANKEATLAGLDPNSPYAKQLAAEIEAEWATAKREGLEAYTNFAGLDIIVKKAQATGVTTRELIEGKVDQEALDAANKKRRQKGDPTRTATQQQAMIDAALTDIKSSYKPENITGAIDDQIRFITHHLNAYFEGHESATQAASALSKYAERAVLLTQLAGGNVTTGAAGELNAIAKDLVKARGNLQDLTRVITGLGNGDANAGIKKLASLISTVLPGMSGLFTPEMITGLTAANGAPGRTATGPGSASLDAMRREKEQEREQVRQASGSGMAARLAQADKTDMEQELARLQAEKADDARMAALYNQSEWRAARDLEAQAAALALQLNALPMTKTATGTTQALAAQLANVNRSLQNIRSRRTATGSAPTESQQWRDRRITSLQTQIQDAASAVTHYQDLAKKEAADAKARVATGNPNFDPSRATQRSLAGPTTTSSTPELDKVGAELAKLFPDPPVPPTATGGSNPIVTGGLTNGGGTIKIDPKGILSVTPFPGSPTYPGLFNPNGGFTLWNPGTTINLDAPPPNPIAETPPSAVPTGNFTMNPDGSVTYFGVPFSGAPGGTGGTTSPLPGSIIFTPPPVTPPDDKKPPTATGGGGAGAGGDSGGGVSIGFPFGWDMNSLGEQKGMGWGEEASFEPNPEPPATYTAGGGGGITDGGDGGGIDLGGGLLGGTPSSCCTAGVQILTLDFGDPATVNPTTTSRDDEAALRFSLPWMARSVFAMLRSLAHGTTPLATATTMRFANQSIGMPPAFTVQQTGAGAQTATAASQIQTIITATGASQGEAFDMKIINQGKSPLKVFGNGVVVEPIKKELQAQVQQQLAKLAGNNAFTRRVEAYCLQYALLPPSPGMLYQIAAPALQKQFKPAGLIMSAARQLAGAGAMHPDSNPKSYLDSIKQYAIWTKFENWDQKKFGEVLLDKTKKAAAAAKANWTGQMESALLSAVPGRWRDVQSILSAAQELSSRNPQ